LDNGKTNLKEPGEEQEEEQQKRKQIVGSLAGPRIEQAGQY